jgi:hypothetical protein
VDLIAEFCLIFILLKISAKICILYQLSSLLQKLPLLFLSIKKDRVKKIGQRGLGYFLR